MSPFFEQYVRRVMSGDASGPRAAALRAAMATAEIPYSLAARARNAFFDRGIRHAVPLPRPVISIGNITAGGTGKTPAVRWLAERLRDAGKTVAILSRGYKAGAPGELGDEQRMLASLLADEPANPPVIVRADPSRARAGQAVLREHPAVDVFLLDDGFQHRQLARDFDLVLVNAVEPFGFGRVMPRGLLREPLAGLRRADAFLLTRVDQVVPARIDGVREVLCRHNPDAPIYQSVHAHSGFRAAAGSTELFSVKALRGRRWFAFCGIAGPESFVKQLDQVGGTRVGLRAFADHHAYTKTEVRCLRAEAAAAGADVLVTTEKDWVKLAALPGAGETGIGLPIWRVDVRIAFHGDDEAALIQRVSDVVATRSGGGR